MNLTTTTTTILIIIIIVVVIIITISRLLEAKSYVLFFNLEVLAPVPCLSSTRSCACEENTEYCVIAPSHVGANRASPLRGTTFYQKSS